MEFDEIARLFRPLTFGAPEARGLLDDAAFLPSRPGQALVVTQDAIVEGVHFLPTDPPELVGRKLLRVNLSDLAAKAAEPYAAFLTVAWPGAWTADMRAAFARGLGEDLRAFGCALMGGDTVSTPGPFTASLTLLGWTPVGKAVERAGARPGDLLLVSGSIGDGVLGLRAARGELDALGREHVGELIQRYQLPEPRLRLRDALRAQATAGADVSDGLLADAGHVAKASGCAVEIALETLPLSPATSAWLGLQPDRTAALTALATGGDDYEIVCAVRPEHASELTASGAAAGVPFTVVGRFMVGQGVSATLQGRPVAVTRTGWSYS